MHNPLVTLYHLSYFLDIECFPNMSPAPAQCTASPAADWHKAAAQATAKTFDL